jgi:hypothetical protein
MKFFEKSRSFFLIMGALILLCSISFAEMDSVKLSDETNPNSLAKCLNDVDTMPGLSGAKENEENKKILECVTNADTFKEETLHHNCAATANKIRSNNELKQKIKDICDIKFYKTKTCVRLSQRLKKKLDENAKSTLPSEAHDKEGGKKLFKTVKSCLENNKNIFPKDFCISFLSEMGLMENNGLLTYCENKVDSRKGDGSGSAATGNQ